MASSAPPVIPVTISQATTTAAQQQPQGAAAAPINTPAVRLFLSRLSDSVRRSFANQRPWHELVDRSAFSRPDSLSESAGRVRKNLSYFRVNYITIFAAVLAVSLVSNPFSLVVLLSLLAAWCFLYLFRPSDPPLVLFGRQFSDWETLWGLIGLSVFVIFLTSVGSILMSAMVVGAGIVGVHGAFRVPEDLFLDDQEPGGAATGFLSAFLGGAASPAPAGAVATGRV